MKAKAVMRMGRSRTRAPASAASKSGFPCSYSSLQNSTMRMAFLAARPITMIRPISEKTSSWKRRTASAARAPKTAMGVPSIHVQKGDPGGRWARSRSPQEPVRAAVVFLPKSVGTRHPGAGAVIA
jgi:hypothetical protein